MFKLPMKSDWMRKQMEHEKTRQYAEDIYKLGKKFPFFNGLEIGCMWGVSTLALLLSNPSARLRSVDKSSFTHAPEETQLNNVDTRWSFINMDSSDYWKQIKDKFDFIYVDGDHHYEYADMDIQRAWEVLWPGGTLALDDVTHENNRGDSKEPYGVAVAAWEHVMDNADIADMGFVGNILYFRKAK